MLTSELAYSQTPPPSAINSLTTSFHCIRQGTGYATVARRGSGGRTKTTSPIITWNDTSFGTKITLEERCKIVSQRLSDAFASRAGRAGTLKITHGIIGSSPVICYIKNTTEKCNSNNVILTLKLTERGQAEEILNQLLKFSVKGTSTPLTRSIDNRKIIELGTQINKAFEADEPIEIGNSFN